jgi:hypothetical protein
MEKIFMTQIALSRNEIREGTENQVDDAEDTGESSSLADSLGITPEELSELISMASANGPITLDSIMAAAEELGIQLSEADAEAILSQSQSSQAAAGVYIDGTSYETSSSCSSTNCTN